MSTLFSTLSTIDILAAFSKSLLFTLAGILPILNPLATAPLYVGFTQDLPESERAQVAKQMGKYVVLMLAGAIVTVASLLIVALLTYLLLTLFGWAYNLRLTMAGWIGRSSSQQNRNRSSRSLPDSLIAP